MSGQHCKRYPLGSQLAMAIVDCYFSIFSQSINTWSCPSVPVSIMRAFVDFTNKQFRGGSGVAQCSLEDPTNEVDLKSKDNRKIKTT